MTLVSDEALAAPAASSADLPPRPEQLVQRIGETLVRAVDDELCSPAWAYCLLDIAKESVVLADDTDVYVAHLLHRSVRAEASKDGPPVSRIATMRAPDLRIAPSAGVRQVALPDTVPEQIQALQDTITVRKSTPMFGTDELPLGQLAAVLKSSFGSKGMERGYQRRDIPRRMAPSAGGLQSFDVQVLVSRVQGLQPGRYLYDPLAHALNLAEPGDFRTPLLESTIETGWIVHAQCVVAITGNFPRVSWKYGTRGYRYMGLDAGVAVGHVYLAAAALGLSVNALAAFADDPTNAMLRLDGKDQFAHILISLGVSPGINWMITALEAVIATVSVLAVFGIGMTVLNFLAGHGVPALRVWVEERSPIVYGLTIATFFAIFVSFGWIDVPRLLVPPALFPAVLALLAAPVVALAMYLLELFLSSRTVVRPAGMIATPSAQEATLRLTERPAVWWSLAAASAVIEEFIFRGMLLPALATGVGVLAAVGISGLIFGLHHITFGIDSVVSKTLGGMLLAGQTLVAGSLVPAIVAHLLFQYLVWRRLRRTGALV